MANKIHEEMFNIFSHKRNANPNYTKIPSHPSQIGNHQENKQRMLASMRRNRNLYRLFMGIETSATTKAISMEVHLNAKNKPSLRPSYSTLGYISEGV
jgi:hypothetical protein